MAIGRLSEDGGPDLSPVAEAFVVLREVGQARGVSEQLPHGHPGLAWPGKGRQVPAHRVIQADLTAADEVEHDRGGGHDFGQRGEIKDRARSHRPPRRAVTLGLAGHMQQHRFATPPPGGEDGAGHHPRSDRCVDQFPGASLTCHPVGLQIPGPGDRP